ncbi:hypothetical protein DDZ13_01605 [Coraliomargarita sinensis]|uniref:Uncharacterized protein n=1 Tax=Coraliomargarita sinensis TaxID=2174842 RepID=A0A317ZJ31_9BACT|nr:Amuc_1100 family pilus-like protein [Coraliomargarita sinensis]PXA05596.1 hypothetical protein DDZ13_01605 [Coraliomargarita sinensis]
MSFFKKNLLFCIVVFLCVAAMCAGLFLAFSASGKVKEAKNSLNSAELQLTALLGSDPAPSVDNLQAAKQNLSELQQSLSQIRKELQKGASLSTSEDGVSVMAGIQQYISKFQKATDEHVDETGEPAEIVTPQDFAFGFEQYIDEASMLEDPEKVSLLDKQRQVLSYLLTQLIASDPESIDKVRREVLEEPAGEGAKTFRVDPAVSARVPGAIDTMGFSLTFSGYTDSLRELLNRLSRFDLPIVVRSIEVDRPSGSETVVAPTNRGGADNIFDLFGGGETAGTEEESSEGPKPVIEENISQFTVILELIEVVLPETQTQEDSDTV